MLPNLGKKQGPPSFSSDSVDSNFSGGKMKVTVRIDRRIEEKERVEASSVISEIEMIDR